MSWRSEVRDRVVAKYGQQAADVFKISVEDSKTDPSIRLVFPDIFTFLDWYPEYRELDAAVLVNSVRAQKNKHFKDVNGVLAAIAQVQYSGVALLDEISMSGKKIHIKPYDNFKKKAFSATERATDRKAGRLKDAPIDEDDPSKGTGTGTGSDSVVGYTAHLFGPNGTSGITGPGSSQAEALYHELVHATRVMRGASHMTKVNHGYHNEEEFLGVVITNIFSSESSLPLRSSHEEFATLQRPEKFLDNVQGTNLSPNTLLKRFYRGQRDFYKALANIPKAYANFNPVRDHYKIWKRTGKMPG